MATVGFGYVPGAQKLFSEMPSTRSAYPGTLLLTEEMERVPEAAVMGNCTMADVQVRAASVARKTSTPL